jgi:hypothetical protein
MPQEDLCTVGGKQNQRQRITLEYPAHAFRPEDLLRLIHMKPFEDSWDDLRLNDDDLVALQLMIMVNPKGAPVVGGTGGLRKIRFAPARWKTGKRGAIRVGYAYLEEYGAVLLILAYAKNEKDNFTPTEKKVFKGLIDEVEKDFKDGVIK